MARRAVEKDDTPKYEPSIYNYKCSEDSSGSRSPTPSKEEQPPIETFGKDTTANTQKSPHGDGEHSDNCSEVSDEGYRSLGAVQSSTANGNSASTQSSPTVADCQSKWTLYIYFACKLRVKFKRDSKSETLHLIQQQNGSFPFEKLIKIRDYFHCPPSGDTLIRLSSVRRLDVHSPASESSYLIRECGMMKRRTGRYVDVQTRALCDRDDVACRGAGDGKENLSTVCRCESRD